MRIAFYAPMKPLDHANPSGDVVIARSIASWLQQRGHHLVTASRIRARWIYWKPGLLAAALLERRRLVRLLRRAPVDLWFTSHCYYKAPDIIGPAVCRRLRIPYVIFQGSYATKYRRRWQTRPGFLLNRTALTAARLLITNRRHDLVDLRRLVADERLLYVRPGIATDRFRFHAHARQELRRRWQAGDRPVLLSAAMFRADVKSRGIAAVIESCLRLHKRGHDFLLVIAGDGVERDRLQRLAARLPAGMVRFTGRLDPEEMARFYSAGDLFVFPGFRESLGMVFLEAQSCGLPVVAYDNGGIPEVVAAGRTGILCPLDDAAAFDRAVAGLLEDPVRRRAMGRQAAAHIREHHDMGKNYRQMETALCALTDQRQGQEERS